MERYKRNILIDGIGEEGQNKLLQSKVLVIGAGGLGSPVLYYLVAAGVGTVGIIDYDIVDITNLQRQIIHNEIDLGRLKIESATEKLKALNPKCNIITYKDKFTADNADTIINDYDFIVDCCDNYDTKFLINDVCVKNKKPYSHGAVVALQGEVMTYIPEHACYRDVFDSQPKDGTIPNSAEIGILGSIAGVIGSIQATETIKYLTGLGNLITNRILIFDGKSMSFHSLKVKKS